MLVKTKTTIETEIDIDFPVYVEYGTNLYKVVSEGEYIKVIVNEAYPDLRYYELEVREGYKINAVMIATEGRPIQQSQFDEAVVLALQHIYAIAFDQENKTIYGADVAFEPEYPPIGNYKNNDVNKF